MSRKTLEPGQAFSKQIKKRPENKEKKNTHKNRTHGHGMHHPAPAGAVRAKNRWGSGRSRRPRLRSMVVPPVAPPGCTPAAPRWLGYNGPPLANMHSAAHCVGPHDRGRRCSGGPRGGVHARRGFAEAAAPAKKTVAGAAMCGGCQTHPNRASERGFSCMWARVSFGGDALQFHLGPGTIAVGAAPSYSARS